MKGCSMKESTTDRTLTELDRLRLKSLTLARVTQIE